MEKLIDGIEHLLDKIQIALALGRIRLTQWKQRRIAKQVSAEVDRLGISIRPRIVINRKIRPIDMRRMH